MRRPRLGRPRTARHPHPRRSATGGRGVRMRIRSTSFRCSSSCALDSPKRSMNSEVARSIVPPAPSSAMAAGCLIDRLGDRHRPGPLHPLTRNKISGSRPQARPRSRGVDELTAGLPQHDDRLQHVPGAGLGHGDQAVRVGEPHETVPDARHGSPVTHPNRLVGITHRAGEGALHRLRRPVLEVADGGGAEIAGDAVNAGAIGPVGRRLISITRSFAPRVRRPVAPTASAGDR